MHKNTTKYNETLSKWYKNKHGASKIIDTFETYQPSLKDREDSDTDYNIDIRHELVFRLVLQLGLA
jgi:hypothetical protein